MKTTLLFLSVFLSASLFGQSNNYSLEFDGENDWIEIQSNNNLNVGNNDFTIECFVKFQSLEAERAIFDYYSNDNSSRINLRKFPDSSLVLYINDDSNNELSRFSDIAVPINSWVHIATTFNRSENTINLYIDGVLQNGVYQVDNVVSSEINPDGVLQFGKYGDGQQDGYLDGNISSISFWHTELSQSEVEQYMSCPPIGNEAGLVGFWNLEEGSGTNALDLTANENDGIINEAIYSDDVPPFDCTSSLTELTPSKNLIQILDLMGRETSFKPNTPLIYVYDDGSIEKVFSVEY